MKVRLKWGERPVEDEQDVEVQEMPRVGEYVTVVALDDTKIRYVVGFVEHLADQRQRGGVPPSGIVAILWVRVKT